jgi:hypothetical protein
VSAKNPSLLESLANAASHPVDTASNIGSALANGAVDLGHRFVDSPLKTTDDAIRGVADTLSFGTADKLAALVASQKNGTSYEDELLKQREQDKAGGSAFTAGQLAGGVLPVSAPIAAARLVPTASTAARVGAGMLAGGAEGAANYLGHSDGPVDAGDLATSAGLGTVLGALPGATMGPTENQLASTFIRKAGGAENAQRDAEIIQGLQGLASRTTQGDAKLGPADANALAARYTQTAADALRQMDKSPERQTLLNALDRTRSMSDDDINALRQLPNGGAVADAIQMRQRALSMTAPTPANSNMLMQGARMAVDNLVPYAPLRHFAINALGGRENRTGNISAALEQAQAAQAALNRLGPSQASQSAQTLAQASLSAQQARLQATQAAQAAAGTRQGVNQFQRGMAAAAQARQAASAGQAQGQQVFQAGQQAAQQARVQNAAAQAQAAAQARSQMANAMQGGAQLRQQAAQAAAPVQADLVAQQKAAQAAQAAQAKEVLKTQAAQRAALAETQASDPTYLLGMSSQFGPPRNPQEMAEFSKLMQNQAQSTTVGPQLPTQKAQAVKAAQVAQAQQAQAAASNVAQGNFQGLDTAHPRLQSMLQFVGSPSAPARAADVLPTLSALAQKDPVMGQKIAQMLSPGAKKLDPASFYGIQQALQASHGNRMEQALAERAAQAAPQAAQTAAPALAQATGDIQNPLAYKAGIANRQTVQKSALAAAQDPEVKKLITKMSTTSKAETRAELFNDFMKGKPAPQQLEAKRLAEPLITYGK